MKKRLFVGLLLCITLIGTLVGCSAKQDGDKNENSNVDYSQYEFADVAWTRDEDCDIEILRFTSEGEFYYSCGCGNPVNDSDAVESYTYNDDAKTFTLHCIEELEDMVTEIKLINCDGNTLELDFDGEIREFVKETE